MLYCEKDFDIKTMELVGIFIKKYRCFENQFFSLHPLVKGCVLKKKGEFIIRLYDNGEYDLFREKKLNVIALCGKNGCGKSTLINLIFDKNDERFLFFKDSNNRIASSDKFCVEYRGNLCRLVDEISLDIVDSLKDDYSTDYKLKHDFWSDFLEHYIADPDLYSFENDGKLFTHYEIHIDPNYIKENAWPHHFSQKKIRYDIPDIDIMNYILYMIIACGFNDVENRRAKLFEKNFHSLVEYANELEKSFPELKKKNQELRNLLFVDYASNLIYKSIRISSVTKLEEIKSFLYNLLDESSKRVGLSSVPINLFRFVPLKIMPNGKRYIYDLSDGQKNSLINRYKIYSSLKQVDESRGLVIKFDEPENTYHPEMARCFWADLIKEVEFTRSYLNNFMEKKIKEHYSWKSKIEILNKRIPTIIVATHSPFLLSDLFRHNILALENKGDGFVREAEIKNTFAGNIAEILCDSMFMNGMIGTFAEEQIQSLFRKKIKNESDLNNRKQLVEQIGDPILKNLLMSELEK